MPRPGDADAVFVISVAAELAGLHPQTLRQYDRLGLVSPARTRGHGRRYSARDVERLRQVQRLSQDEGVNLAGIKAILALEQRVERLEAELDAVRAAASRVFAAGAAGEVVAVRSGRRPPRRELSTALVLWRPGRTGG